MQKRRERSHEISLIIKRKNNQRVVDVNSYRALFAMPYLPCLQYYLGVPIATSVGARFKFMRQSARKGHRILYAAFRTVESLGFHDIYEIFGE